MAIIDFFFRNPEKTLIEFKFKQPRLESGVSQTRHHAEHGMRMVLCSEIDPCLIGGRGDSTKYGRVVAEFVSNENPKWCEEL